MVQLTLANFIKKNEKMIFVLGIFLAFLPLSFDTIKKLNQEYAGVIAIATSVVILLILIQFFRGKKNELSFEALLFLGCLTTIAVVVVLLTYAIYNDMTLLFLDGVLSIFYFCAGVFLSVKFFEKLKRKKSKFFVNLTMLLLFIFLVVFNVDKRLNSFLLHINFVIPPFLTLEYQSLFFGGIYFILSIYAVFFSGLSYFGKECFYEKIILKIFLKIKSKLKKKGIKNKK